jgi:transposase InsO family protein
MEVSRSGYYKWLKRKDSLNLYEVKRIWLKDQILDTYVKHKVWGYKNRAQVIRNATGVYFSDLLCHLMCKELGIKSKARRKQLSAGSEHEEYPNQLYTFKTKRPFEKVCTDTTILTHKTGKYDWNIYIDLYDHAMISYDLTKSRHAADPGNHHRAAKRFLEEKEKRGYTNLETIVHSDQGVIYTSRAFNSIFNDTIIRSMSRIATPTDNPIIEALNGWIKDDLKYDYDFFHCENPKKVIKQFVDYFNNHRLAYSLKYKTPTQFRTESGFN